MLQEQISPYWRNLMMRLEAAKDAETASVQEVPSKNKGAVLVCPIINAEQVGDAIDVSEALCAIRRQILASKNEDIILSCETEDPLGAHAYEVGGNAAGGRLVHQYKNRSLFLVTGKCFAHCRYCFRRESPSLKFPPASETEIRAVCAYIDSHREVKEIILTGGDPLTLNDDSLEAIFAQLRQVRPDILIRVGTRAPVFAPERITANFVQLLRKFRPLWLIPHINHPTEICTHFAPEARQALQSLLDAGIPMQSQTVLLNGVNDSLPILSRLFQDLTALGIKPGYLFQGDMAPGTSHFRVPLKTGIALYKNLRSELSGLSTPIYAVDLPDGGGKVNLLQITSTQLTSLEKLYTK